MTIEVAAPILDDNKRKISSYSHWRKTPMINDQAMGK